CEAGGAMVSLEAGEDEAVVALAEVGGRISVAAVNGPRQTVISGDAAAVERVRARFAALGRRTRRLQVSHAFHSPHMDGMLAALREVAEDCAFRSPQIAVVSAVDGALVEVGATSGAMLSAEYWVRQVRAPVRFHEAIARLHAEGVRRFVECGPAGVLAAMAAQCVPEGAAFVASLGDGDEVAAIRAAQGRWFCAG